MNEQFWKNVTDGIDEKYTDEAAECFSKHAPSELTVSDFTEYTPSAEPKRSKIGMWLGIGAAAAALVLCIGGAFFLRGDSLLPADTVTEEATFESGENIDEPITEIEVTAEIAEQSAEATSEAADSDEWRSMKHYTGDEPEVLAFIDEISAGALEYQEQVQRNALENAEDDSYREAAQQAIDEGGLDIYTDSAYYVQTDNGSEFWMKCYRIYMVLNADYFEFYYRDENGFALLHTLNSGMINVICDGKALYYSSSDGCVEMIQPDGSRKELLNITDKAKAGAEEFDLLGISISGYGESLTALASYGSHSEKAGDWLFCDDTYVLEDGEIISASSTGFGYEIRNGVAMPYPYIGGAHGHEDIDLNNEDLLILGRMRLDSAVKLYQIMHRLPEGDENDRLDGALIALDNSYFTTKNGRHDSISDLYDYTFAQDIYAYKDVYFAVQDPEEAPWLTYDHRGDITLKEHIESRLHYQDGKVYAVDDCSVESNAAWTNIVGVLDYEEGVYADYLLCTACFDGNGGLTFEHSVMTLECFEGVWLITQLRWHLGNEYGESRKQLLIDMGHDYLVDAPLTTVEIFERDLLQPKGYTLMCDTKLDLDLDGEEELLLLAGKSGERSIFVFDKIYNDWHFSEQLTDERFSGMSTLDAHRYSDGDRKGWFFVNGEPEYATLVMVEFVKEGEPDGGNIDGGRYVVGDVPEAEKDEYAHKCCEYDLSIPGTSGYSYFEDFDNDGTKEQMVHILDSFYFFEKIHGYWILQQTLCDEWLVKAGLSPVDWGYQGISNMRLGLDRSDYDGCCWLYEYWGGYDNCVAEITAAIKHNETDGYYIDYICSRGQYLEPVNGMPDFRRYGWDESTDFERLTTDEYAELHSELFGYDESAYSVPTGSRLQTGLIVVGEDDVGVYAKRLAAAVLSDLCGYDGGQRTFSIFEYENIEVALTPIAQADASWNVTAEEKALGQAWIAEISADVRFTGRLGDYLHGGFNISEYDDGGWLIWRDGDSYFIRSRSSDRTA